jgi:hypothetical protein
LTPGERQQRAIAPEQGCGRDAHGIAPSASSSASAARWSARSRSCLAAARRISASSSAPSPVDEIAAHQCRERQQLVDVARDGVGGAAHVGDDRATRVALLGLHRTSVIHPA